MKRSILLLGVVVFVMITLTTTAQNGGMNIGSLQATESIQVGTASDNVVVLSDLVALPPLSDSDILLIVDPAEGSIVYATKSDVLLVFDGIKWKRMDGQNDSYLFGNSCPGMPTITDIDGNTYNTVLIGTQCWMRENLKVTHYPNGDIIPSITGTGSDAQWGDLLDTNSDVAYCYYNNDLNDEKDTYGALYTYAAAIALNWTKDEDLILNEQGGQGICPDGWHLPTDAEWKVLEGNVDSTYPVEDAEWNGTGYRGDDAGSHLKSDSGWFSNVNGDNSSGYTALPGGKRDSENGVFGLGGNYGGWWSATEGSDINTWYRSLHYNNANVNRSSSRKSIGFSVRCLRN